MIQKTVTFFVGKTNQQRIMLSREHSGYLWLPFEQAYQRLTYENAKDLLNKADQFIKKSNKEELQ